MTPKERAEKMFLDMMPCTQGKLIGSYVALWSSPTTASRVYWAAQAENVLADLFKRRLVMFHETWSKSGSKVIKREWFRVKAVQRIHDSVVVERV